MFVVLSYLPKLIPYGHQALDIVGTWLSLKWFMHCSSFAYILVPPNSKTGKLVSFPTDSLPG